MTAHQLWTVDFEDLRWLLADGTPATDEQADAIALGALEGRLERVRTRAATWGPCSRRHATTLYRRWYQGLDSADRWRVVPEINPA